MQGAQCEIGRKLSRRLTARQITCVIEEERVLAKHRMQNRTRRTISDFPSGFPTELMYNDKFLIQTV